MELWDTKVMETSMMLKITNMAEQPKVLKTRDLEVSIYILLRNLSTGRFRGNGNLSDRKSLGRENVVPAKI